MTAPCEMDSKNWCSKHKMHHNGKAAQYAIGVDSKSIRLREIWDNMVNGQRDDTLPAPSPHLPQFDDCPHRGLLIDKTTCGCKAFLCKLHGTCTTQKRTGLRLCQDCNDYPFKENPFIEILSKETGKHGVVIGSYGMPGVVELSIAMIRKTCGNVPVLISDDCTPESMGRQRLVEMTQRWPAVSLIVGKENLGHAPGDVRAFRNGIRWAVANGISYLCKLSQRFIFLADNWLQSMCEEMEREGHAVSSQRAVHLHMQFAMRTECVFLDVNRCAASQRFMELIDPTGGKIPTAAEDWIAAAINQGGLGPMHRCRKIPVDRFMKRNDILWHNTDGRDVYGASDGGDAYRQWAEKLGVDLGPEFSAAGWHVIAPNRPDANYHML